MFSDPLTTCLVAFPIWSKRHGCHRTTCFVGLGGWPFQNLPLDDPRLSLFITHCGQGSTTEANYAGEHGVFEWHRYLEYNFISTPSDPLSCLVCKVSSEGSGNDYSMNDMIRQISCTYFLIFVSGVPLVVVPVLLDQVRNAYAMKRAGVAVVLEKSLLATPGPFTESIREVLDNSR